LLLTPYFQNSMNIHNLDPIFNPKRIALIGVTTNPNSISGKVLINLVSRGFRGVVYPVNPDHEADNNQRMISVFRKRGFEIRTSSKDSTVDVMKEL
jgi:predicted CoA-binding protein